MSTIAALRAQRQLTVEALAAQFGISSKIIESWEAGRSSPNQRQVEMLARYFDVSPEAIVSAVTIAPTSQPSEYDASRITDDA